MTRLVHRGSRSRGQGLVEFALVLPVFMVILIGMVDLGRAIWANNSVANAAREAARFAAVHGGSCKDLTSTACGSTSYCPVGPRGPLTAVPAASTSCPYPSPSKTAVRDTATGFLVGGGPSSTVTVCYGSACSGDADSQSTNVRGTPVTVVVSTQVPIILGSFLGFSTMTVSSTSTMLINH
jgi:TadE-like protein